MPLFQFIGAALGAGVMLSLTSLIWPRVTIDPRPPVLTKVHDVVLQTEVGKNAAMVLGVSDESQVHPVSLPLLVQEGATAALDGVVTTVQHNATSKLMESLAKQFEKLPADEKAAFRAEICQPATTSAEHQ